jgi:hypothetical protein
MKRSLWIAADLLEDAMATGAFWSVGAFLGLWLPLQAGLIDGLASRGFPLFALRHSMTLNASWPVLAVLGLHAHVFLPRRIRRELEPLLLTPIDDLDLVAGLSLPMLGVMLAAPPLTFGLNMAGFRFAAGRLPAEMPTEFGMLCLGTQVACLWLTAASVDASLRATTQAGYMARLLAGYALVGVLDAAFLVLRLTGYPRLQVPAMCLAMAGGAVVLGLVSRRVDRELLIRRI